MAADLHRWRRPGLSGLSAAAAPSQRATGTLLLAVKRRGDATVLDQFRQEGCLKARLPRPERGAWTTAVTLNSSGGVVQGDRLTTAVTAGPGTCLTVASQAAERFYRSPGGSPALLRTALSVAPGAALEWLPQEAILFDRCALDRRLEIGVAAGGWLLAVETLVFGRALMGETVREALLRDTIQVRQGGRLVLHDAIRLDGPVQDTLARPAGGGRRPGRGDPDPRRAGCPGRAGRAACEPCAVRGRGFGGGRRAGGAYRGARWGLCTGRDRGRIGRAAERPAAASSLELLTP